jgi:hypothetical protein
LSFCDKDSPEAFLSTVACSRTAVNASRLLLAGLLCKTNPRTPHSVNSTGQISRIIVIVERYKQGNTATATAQTLILCSKPS